MLSERERQELEAIERELSSDRRLSARLAQPGDKQLRRRLRWARLCVGFGVLVMVTGGALGLDLTVLQGMVVTFAGALWWTALRTPTQSGPQRPRRQR
jgi:Flp pilus assembly protein TadB